MKKVLGIAAVGALVLLALVHFGLEWLGEDFSGSTAVVVEEVSAPEREVAELGTLETDRESQGDPLGRIAVDPTVEAAAESETATAVLVELLLEKDRSPVAGVTVRVRADDDDAFHEGDDQAVTDERGLARFPLRHGTSVFGVLVRPGVETVGRFAPLRRSVIGGTVERITVLVSGGGRLAGVVVDGRGDPIAGATARAWCASSYRIQNRPETEPDREGTADASGRFALEHVGEEFVLKASAPGLVCRSFLHGEIGSGETIDGLVLVLSPVGRVAGRVVGPGGAQLEGVEISAYARWDPREEEPANEIPGVAAMAPPTPDVVSGADGGFLFEGLLELDHEWKVDHPGFRPWEKRHAPAEGFLLVELDHGLELTGRILGADRRSLSGARVRIAMKARGETVTDEEGRFRLRGLVRDPAATLYVQAEAHAILVHQPLAIRREGPNELELVLEPERPIAGRVIDVDGAGVANAGITVEGDRVVDTGAFSMHPTPTWERHHRVNATRTDEAGAFRLPRLYAGSFRLEATDPDDPELRVALEVESGTEDVIVVLDPDAVRDVRLVGRVTDAFSGEPVGSFEVIGWSIHPDHRDWEMDSQSFETEDGSYEIRGLEPGIFTLYFHADGYARQEVRQREYAVGEHRLDVVLHPERSIHVRVVDRQGTPFEGLVVWFEELDGNRLFFDVVGQPHQGMSATLDAEGEARFGALPAKPLHFTVGGLLSTEVTRFEVDLTTEPQGVQEFVVEAARPATLPLLLVGAAADAKFAEFELRGDLAELQAEIGEREDLWALDAESAAVEVLDGEGEVRGTASATFLPGGGYELVWSRGSVTYSAHRPGTPSFELAVPPVAVRVKVEAEGYSAVEWRLSAEELATAGESSRGWVVFLRRGS